MSAIEKLLNELQLAFERNSHCCVGAELGLLIAIQYGVLDAIKAVRDELAEQSMEAMGFKKQATLPDYGEPFTSEDGNLRDRWGAYPRSEAVKAIALRANALAGVRNPAVVGKLIVEMRELPNIMIYPKLWIRRFDKDPSNANSRTD